MQVMCAALMPCWCAVIFSERWITASGLSRVWSSVTKGKSGPVWCQATERANLHVHSLIARESGKGGWGVSRLIMMSWCINRTGVPDIPQVCVIRLHPLIQPWRVQSVSQQGLCAHDAPAEGASWAPAALLSEKSCCCSMCMHGNHIKASYGSRDVGFFRGKNSIAVFILSVRFPSFLPLIGLCLIICVCVCLCVHYRTLSLDSIQLN